MKKVLTSPKKDGLYMPSCLSHVGESVNADIYLSSHIYGLTIGSIHYLSN